MDPCPIDPLDFLRHIQVNGPVSESVGVSEFVGMQFFLKKPSNLC